MTLPSSSSRLRNAHPPGASPLHVKGVVYRGTQEFFRDEVAGGPDALYAQLASDPALLAFMQQTFLPSSWYDAMPMATLIHAESRAMGLSLAHYMRLRTRYQAERDINGVYRFLVKVVSPDAVARRLPRLMQQMLDFGTTESSVVSPGHAEMTVRGFPAVLTEWYTGSFGVYADVALRLAGAEKVTITVKAPEPEPSRDGIALVTIALEARYT